MLVRMDFSKIEGLAGIVDHTSAMDAMIGAPAGTVAAAATVVVAAVSIVMCSGLCFGGARKAAKSQRQRKRTVLLTGPVSSGKTLMFHQLLFNKQVETVMSMQPNAIQKQLADEDESATPINLVDFPGAGQLRDALLRAAADAGAIVVVIDAAGDAAHLSSAAGLLYDLMTCRQVVEGPGGASGTSEPPPVLVVAHQADKPGARPVAGLRRELEADLERLKVSRAAFVTHGSDTGVDGGAEDDRLLLGVPGKPFSFDAHAPLSVAWATASSTKAGQLTAVREFVRQHVE